MIKKQNGFRQLDSAYKKNIFIQSDNIARIELYAIVLLITSLVSSCKQQVPSGQGPGLLAPNIQSGSCNIGKWSKSSLPLNLKISSEIESDFDNSDLIGGLNPIEQIAKVWNNAVAPTAVLFQLPFAIASGEGSDNLAGFRDSDFGIYKSHTWFSSVSSNALAITQFFGILKSDGSLGIYIDLTHVDIILNYRDYGSDFTYNKYSLTGYDVPTILLHEMGHFLGLCHENNYNSIMAPYYFTTQRSLKTFDTNKIKALYLNNQNYGGSPNADALSVPIGSEVNGVVELDSSGICKHYINGKLVYQHIQQ